MSVGVNSILETLIKKRILVFSALGGVLLLSLGGGYYYQNRQNREKEAANLYDQSWENIYAVIAEAQSTNSTPERRQAAAGLYAENIKNIDSLILDYPETAAAARAALLFVHIAEEPVLKEMLGTNTLEASAEGALDAVKKYHPKFWASALSMAEGIRHEKAFRFAEANTAYEAALAGDKEKFLSDFLLISIARNKEILQDKPGALKDYQSLVDEYPDSPWNSFALGKIYLLSQNSPAPAKP